MSDEGHKLGEVLRAAREAKGTDLARVERDTKIRERYLSALERGEYYELPGAVYTKGFLRNYGSYLGLDPEYLIDLYRLETSGSPERPVAPTPPRPMAVRRRRTFVVAPGAVVAAILTIMVGGLLAVLGYQLLNFAQLPELRVVEPASDLAAHPERTITIRGITEANARVTVSGLPENPTTTADASGNFQLTVGLLPGSNEIHLVAFDPATRRSSEFVRRVNMVTEAGGSPSGVTVNVTQPEADARLTGPVPVAGTAEPEAEVEVSAALAGPPDPSFVVTDAAGDVVAINPADPPAPAPTVLTPDADGAFNGTLALAAGTWDVTVAIAGLEPTVRRVTVGPGAGLSGRLRVDGGESYLEVEQDGTPIEGVSGGISDDGARVELRADASIRVRAGNAGAVRLSINGITFGPMGRDNAVIEWRITRSGS